MDGGTAIERVNLGGERSFVKEIGKLTMGAGEEFHGEGILAVTKALLQSGISYVGGYPGAPMSHLIDVFAEASKEILNSFQRKISRKRQFSHSSLAQMI